ncbi:MAG: hypothetical protein ACD_50C00126G0001 [uncultured bacterium]|nr:MAG: hypothetical protein ACD_50C00126G0001 [uncultured bacterium]OGH13541.1 MAG: hypothetical protein A2687_00120 [Candidatus Levybacteria bacterium RIFCSPHIGHO2_01_FULL_38_26]
MPGKHLTINLLKENQLDFFGEFIKWTLTIGRILVIVTEIIALGAFVYRFSLDRRLIDLRSEIRQKQTIIAAQKANEDKYQDLHDRIYVASNFSSLAQERNKILKDVLNFTPQGIRLNSLALQPDKMTIEANVTLSNSLGFFVNSLKNYPVVESITIDNIEQRPQANFVFAGITANLKKSKFDAQMPSDDSQNPNPNETKEESN